MGAQKYSWEDSDTYRKRKMWFWRGDDFGLSISIPDNLCIEWIGLACEPVHQHAGLVTLCQDSHVGPILTTDMVPKACQSH